MNEDKAAKAGGTSAVPPSEPDPEVPRDQPEVQAANGAATAAADASTTEPAPGDTAGQEPAVEPAAPSAEDLQARVDELNGQLLRALAEVDNVRKRNERMLADAHKFAVGNFAKDLLSAADNLHRAIDAVPEAERATSELLAKLLEGVAAVERELLGVFEKHGITKLEPFDTPFDPNFHEAVFEVPNSGKPAGTVVQVLQSGYTLHGRLLRAAMVGVAKGNGAPPEHKVDTTA